MTWLRVAGIIAGLAILVFGLAVLIPIYESFKIGEEKAALTSKLHALRVEVLDACKDNVLSQSKLQALETRWKPTRFLDRNIRFRLANCEDGLIIYGSSQEERKPLLTNYGWIYLQVYSNVRNSTCFHGNMPAVDWRRQ